MGHTTFINRLLPRRFKFFLTKSNDISRGSKKGFRFHTILRTTLSDNGLEKDEGRTRVHGQISIVGIVRKNLGAYIPFLGTFSWRSKVTLC